MNSASFVVKQFYTSARVSVPDSFSLGTTLETTKSLFDSLLVTYYRPPSSERLIIREH